MPGVPDLDITDHDHWLCFTGTTRPDGRGLPIIPYEELADWFNGPPDYGLRLITSTSAMEASCFNVHCAVTVRVDEAVHGGPPPISLRIAQG